MKMKILFSLGLLAFSVSAQAALSPYYQSTAEINAILEHKDVAELGDSVLLVQRKEQNDTGRKYLVSSENCYIHVEVQYVPSKIIGPAQFKLKVEPKVCKD